MKNLLRSLVFCSLILCAAISCKKKTVDMLEVSPNTEINCGPEGDTLVFSVTSNGEWTVDVPDWSVATPLIGEGNGTFTVIVQPNQNTEERKGEIGVECGTVSVVISITQGKKEEEKEEELPPLNPNSDYVDLGMDKVDVTLAYDTLSGRVTVTYPDANIPNLYEGAAFVLPDDYNYDIRVVDSYTSSGNTLTMQTSSGNMCNLFRNVSFTLSTAATAETKSADGGHVFPPVSYGYIDNKGEYHELYNKDDLTKSEYNVKFLDYHKNYDGEVLWEGKWGEISWKKCSDRFSLDAVFEFDFGETTKEEKKIGDLKYFTGELRGGLEIDRLLRYEVNKEYEKEKDEIIQDNIIETGVFKFAPGGVPVVILVYTHLGQYTYFSAEGSIEAEAGYNLKGEMKAGLQWKKGEKTTPIISVTKTFKPYEAFFNAKASASAKISYYPRVEVGLYSKSGFQFDFKPYIKETVNAGVRVSSEDSDYIGWRSETFTGMDMEIALKADFGFWDKELWSSGKINTIEDTPIFYAPERISILSPENNTVLPSMADSAKIELLAESYSPLTGKYYPCSFAFINFNETNGILNDKFAITDSKGKASTVWYPFMAKETKSGSQSDSTYVTERLLSSIVDGEGNRISQTMLTLRYKKDTLEAQMREKLIQFYKDTDGDNWTQKENWCSDRPLREWYGLEYDNGYYKLKLSKNNLSGDGKLEDCVLLKYVALSNNQLTSLDLSGCSFLEELYCSNNKLTVLDLTQCTSLGTLECYTNQLTSLNVSGLTSLKSLKCSSNKLISLDLTACTSLTTLSTGTNQLTTLNLDGCVSLESLYCTKNQLADLNLTQCSSLQTLECEQNQLTSLDLSGLTTLQELNCSSNKLTSINLTGCSSLQTIECEHNLLTSLNVSGLTSLKGLTCSSNKLTVLDVSGLLNLTGVECQDNILASLNVSGCSALKSLKCQSNKLISLDLTACASLTTLRAGTNQLTTLNLDGCESLNSLYCANNQLVTLDLSDCVKLESITCNSNQLISLDLSMCPNLKKVTCYSNKLTALNISGCYKITTIDCCSNQIGALNTAGLTSLAILKCESNLLTSLDISATKETIRTVRCYGNQITSIDASGCAKLEELSCSQNQLTSLNVKGCVALYELSCHDNKLTSLDASDCGKLHVLRCQKNEISSLVLPVTTTLKYLWCQKNKITAEIPEWFDNITTFEYDRRYTNYRKDYSEDVNGKLVYKDNGVGWWYPGEPDKGYHKRD